MLLSLLECVVVLLMIPCNHERATTLAHAGPVLGLELELDSTASYQQKLSVNMAVRSLNSFTAAPS